MTLFAIRVVGTPVKWPEADPISSESWISPVDPQKGSEPGWRGTSQALSVTLRAQP
jgi:hypothetical protein